MNREELIATASRIKDLRDEIGRLSGLQRELKGLEARLDELTGVPAEIAPRRTRQSFSIEDQIFQFLRENAESDWSAEAVSQKVGSKLPTTRAAFSKLRKAGKIIDTRRGHVQAKLVDTSDAPEEDTKLGPRAA